MPLGLHLEERDPEHQEELALHRLRAPGSSLWAWSPKSGAEAYEVIFTATAVMSSAAGP